MPFRIKVSLWILALLAFLVLIGPFLVPIAPLTGTRPVRELAWPGSAWVEVGGLQVHVEAVAGGAVVRPPDGAGSVAAAASVVAGAPAASVVAAAPAASVVAAAPAADEPAFLLLHGFGANTRSWGGSLPWLGADGLAVAYDRPAFGLTERPLRGWPRDANPYGPAAQVATAIGVLDAFGVDRAVLIGHSAGGAIALQTALAHPDRVAGLVLVGAAVYAGGGAPSWIRPLLHTPQAARVGPLIMRQLGGAQGDAFLRSSWADPARLDAATYEAYRRALLAENWDRGLWELVKASRESDLVPFLAEVRVPVLVVTGAQDAIVPEALSRDLARDLVNAQGGATLVTLEGCGHLPHEECPAEFRSSVEAWLAEAAPRF